MEQGHIILESPTNQLVSSIMNQTKIITVEL